MGRKHDTRGVPSDGASESERGPPPSRRVPDDDRSGIQRRLRDAIDEARAVDGAIDREDATGKPPRLVDDVDRGARRREREERLDDMDSKLDELPADRTERDEGGETAADADAPTADADGDMGEADDGDDEDGGLGELFEGGGAIFDEPSSSPSAVGEGADGGRDDTTSAAGTEESGDEDDGDAFDESPVGGEFAHLGVDGGGTPGELAREYLREDVVAERHRTGDGGQRASPADESRPNRIGGWDEYDPEDIEEFHPLGNLGGGASSAQYMDEARFEGDDGADSAFVTYYSEDARDTANSPPRKEYAARRMAMFAFCDAVGARTVPHTYNTDEEWVASRGVDGYDICEIEHPATHDDPNEEIAAVALSVDREEYIDQMAVQILGGNRDLHDLNLIIDDEGRTHYIDLDLGACDPSRLDTERAVESSMRLGKARAEASDESPDEFVVEHGEIVGRAQEIAVAIHNSGDTDRIVDAVREYDEAFEEVDESLHRNIRENIERFVESAREGRLPDIDAGDPSLGI